MATIQKRVAHKIKESRIAKGLTQKEVSEKIGVTETVITNYESGRQNLTIGTLQKIADAIGVSMAELVS